MTIILEPVLWLGPSVVLCTSPVAVLLIAVGSYRPLFLRSLPALGLVIGSLQQILGILIMRFAALIIYQIFLASWFAAKEGSP